MSQHRTIKRYSLILEKVQKSCPSADEMLTFLERFDFNISKRTLERDLEAMRNEYDVNIVYNRTKRGYELQDSEGNDVSTFLRFLEVAQTAILIENSLADGKKAMQFMDFDQGGGLIGLSNLEPLLRACSERRKISFNHTSFQSGNTRRYSLNPYLLKEYLNRWYIVGEVRGLKELRTFGIDRLTDLEVSDELFEPKAKWKPKENFQKVIGLVYEGDKTETVRLKINAEQIPYVKSLPFHSSQTIEEENEEYMIIHLRIIPNYELTQQILQHNSRITVLEPQHLREEIIHLLESSLEKYKR